MGMAVFSRTAVVVGGRRVTVRPLERALLECLHKNIGSAVPYRALCAILGYGRATAARKHALQQQIVHLRRLLDERGVRMVIAVAPDVGYALCPLRRANGANGKFKRDR